MLTVLILFIAAIFFRVIVVRFAPEGFDEFGHLYYVKEVKAQVAGPFGKIRPQVVGARDFRHPFLWHWIMGFIPMQILLKYKKWINPVADALFVVLIYGIGRWLGLNDEQSVWVSLMYLFTPMWFSRLSIGPRIDSLTPRLASELVTNIFFVVTLLPLGLPLWLILLAGSTLAAVVLLSSKFGLQALFLIVPLTSLLILNIMPFVALTMGVFIAFGVTKGVFFETLKQQFIHLTWYFKKNRRGEVPVSKRNSIEKILKDLDFKNEFKITYFKLVKRLISKNSYTAVLLKMPVLVVVVIFYFYSLVQGTYIPPGFINGPVLAATIIFFLINVPVLLFLGEAERYLNHVAFFIVGAAVLFISNLGLYCALWVLFVYGVCYWGVESFILNRLTSDCKKAKEDVDKDVITFLQAMKDPAVIACYPYHAVGVWRIMLETIHKVVFPYIADKKFINFFEEEYAADYPYFKLEKFDEMAEDLNISLVIAEEDNLLSKGHDQWVPPEGWKRIKVGEPVYKIYVREDFEKSDLSS